MEVMWGSAAYPDSIFVGTALGWHRCVTMDWVTRNEVGDFEVITADEFATYYREIT